jgi:hypothetical protein
VIVNNLIVLRLYFGTVGSSFNGGLGVRRDEPKNKPGRSEASLFTTNITKGTKNGFNFKSTNSIRKSCINEKNDGTKIMRQDIISRGEQSTLGNVVNTQLPEIAGIQLGVKTVTRGRAPAIIVPKTIFH